MADSRQTEAISPCVCISGLWVCECLVVFLHTEAEKYEWIAATASSHSPQFLLYDMFSVCSVCRWYYWEENSSAYDFQKKTSPSVSLHCLIIFQPPFPLELLLQFFCRYFAIVGIPRLPSTALSFLQDVHQRCPW